MRIVLFVICSIFASAISATELPYKQQCETLISIALQTEGDREQRFMLLTSKTVRGCFERFPGLKEQFFPIKMPAAIDLRDPPVNKDPAFTIKMQ